MNAKRLRTAGLALGLLLPLASWPQAHRAGEGDPRSEGANDFVPLRQPRFVPASQAEFLKDGDRVVGVAENGEAKAYEPEVTAWHHVVEDRLGTMPVIVTWCSLCNTPLVYRSEVDGKRLTFQRAGNRGNNFYMSDAETGSFWQQIGGECFEGPMKGKRLTMVPFLYTTWKEWRTQHPDTLALVPEPAYKKGYDQMAQRIASIQYGSSRNPGRPLVREADSRLPNYAEVIGIEIGSAHKAYPATILSKEHVLDDQIGSTPILLIDLPGSDTVIAFSRALTGRTLTFQPAQNGDIVDQETHSQWNPYGECTFGKLKGRKLQRIIVQPGFWFAWAEFFPDTQVYSEAH